jgi:catechol 2,3-dioxygenase
MNSFSLLSQTSIRHVRMRIWSLETTAHFYSTILGFARLPSPAPDIAAFGFAPNKPQILLTEDRAAPLGSESSLGLHDVALRYPTRRDLAHALRRLVENDYPIGGRTHHGVPPSSDH